MKKFLLSFWLSLGPCLAADPPQPAATMRLEKSQEKEGRHEIVIVNHSDRNFSFPGYDISKRIDFKRYYVHYSTQLVVEGKWKDATPAWDAERTVPLNLPAGQTLRCHYSHAPFSVGASRFRLTLRLQEGTAETWDPGAKAVVVASPVYFHDGTGYREVTREDTGTIPPESYKGAAPSWKQVRSIRDVVNVASVLEHAGREKAKLDEFLALLPPRYPKAQVTVLSADSTMGGLGRPPTGTRWTAKVSTVEGKPTIQESVWERHQPLGQLKSSVERGMEVPEIDASRRVWYRYLHEDAVAGSWALEVDPPPLHIQQITFDFDLGALRRGNPANLKDLVLAAPPPRFPIKGAIGIFHPRVLPQDFEVIIRNGRYETTSELGTHGEVFFYTWQNPHPALPQDQ